MTEGEEVSRAQSSGECPGVKRTFRRGLAGMPVCVGGGAREEDGGPRLGRGERMGGAMRPGEVGVEFKRGGPLMPPETRWAEFAPAKEL